MRRAFVINDNCIKDMRCVAACLRRAIQPTRENGAFIGATQLHINPKRCIGCGACTNACLNEAIYSPEDSVAEFARFAEVNAAWFRV